MRQLEGSFRSVDVMPYEQDRDERKLPAGILALSDMFSGVSTRLELLEDAKRVLTMLCDELTTGSEIKNYPLPFDADEEKSKSLLAKIALFLVDGIVVQLSVKNDYCSGALLRQIVEVEYLAWYFAENAGSAKVWMNCTNSERNKKFSPRAIRESSSQKFDQIEYQMHCRSGGHPTPDADRIFSSGLTERQILVVDLIHHLRNICSHCANWIIEPSLRFLEVRKELIVFCEVVNQYFAEDKFVGMLRNREGSP